MKDFNEKTGPPAGEVWNDRRFQVALLKQFDRACVLLEMILAQMQQQQQPENKNVTIERNLKK